MLIFFKLTCSSWSRRPMSSVSSTMPLWQAVNVRRFLSSKNPSGSWDIRLWFKLILSKSSFIVIVMSCLLKTKLSKHAPNILLNSLWSHRDPQTCMWTISRLEITQFLTILVIFYQQITYHNRVVLTLFYLTVILLRQRTLCYAIYI